MSSVSSTQKSHNSVMSSIIGPDEFDASSTHCKDRAAIVASCDVNDQRACLVTSHAGE